MLYTVYKLYIDWIKNKHCLYNQYVFLPFQMKIDVHFVMFCLPVSCTGAYANNLTTSCTHGGCKGLWPLWVDLVNMIFSR